MQWGREEREYFLEKGNDLKSKKLFGLNKRKNFKSGLVR
jgi:hypothetical protein